MLLRSRCVLRDSLDFPLIFTHPCVSNLRGVKVQMCSLSDECSSLSSSTLYVYLYSMLKGLSQHRCNITFSR